MGDKTDNTSNDQQRFDREVAQKGKVALEVLAGVGVFAALVMSLVALLRSAQTEPAGAAPRAMAMSSPGGGTAAQTVPASATAPAAAPKVISLKVVPEGKRGPEGKLHDVFTVTNFSVKAGQPVTLRIDNTDTATHTITAAEAGVDIKVAPGTHDYTLLVSKAGRFEWNCMLPCDEWAMSHVGYMAGYITAS